MPLWQIYHPPSAFNNQELKDAFAADITKFYTGLGLPAFYVVANFVAVDPYNFLVGGKPRTGKPFVRLVIEHVAIHSENNPERHQATTTRIDAILKPHIADKGYDWEYHIDETPRGLWKVNGLVPPPHKSEAEQLWVKEDKAVEWEEGRI